MIAFTIRRKLIRESPGRLIFVLARDLEYSCAASLTFVSWNGSARGSL